MKPLLSIIVPIYNADKYLNKCLTSILDQDLKNWECFLIDDGSTDRSRSVCDFFCLKDSRFKYIYKYNEGPAAARNLGLYLAQGDWIGFVDADDWIETNRFSSAIKIAQDNNEQIVQCCINVYKNNIVDKIWHLGETNKSYSIKDGLFLSDPVYDIGHCWDKIYKADLLKDNNIKFAKCDMCEDTFFNIHALCFAGSIYSQADKVYNYVLQKGTLSHSTLKGSRKINVIREYQRNLTELSKLENFKYIEKNYKEFFEKIFTRPDQIDYVFPYVDSGKTDWQEKYMRYTHQTIDTQRFAGHEEFLKYKFRAIEKWMPWIGTIHFLVDSESQVPDWINTDEVHVVYHKDFIPAEYLPTFNSCTIEMFLQNIPGLSEKFIYGNDDFYANDILKPKFFFPEDGKIKADLHLRKLWHAGDINLDWAQIPINSLKLAAKDKPKYLEKYVDGEHLYEPQHIDKPMLKSVNKEVFEKYSSEIYLSISRIRKVKNLNQYLFIEYTLFHNKGVFETFRYAYFQVGIETDKIIKALTTTEARPREICCNESSKATEVDYEKILKEFQKLYREKSIYEV